MFRKIVLWKIKNNVKSKLLLFTIAFFSSILSIFIYHNTKSNDLLSIIYILLPMLIIYVIFIEICRIIDLHVNTRFVVGKKSLSESFFLILTPIPFVGQGLLAWRCTVLLDEIRIHIKNKTLTLEEIENGIYLNSPQNIERRKKEGLL